MILKRFRDPQFTTNILIYSSVIFLIKNLYFGCYISILQFSNYKMNWNKWSNQVILPEIVLTIPILPRNSINFCIFMVQVLPCSSQKFFSIHPSTIYIPLFCNSFSKSLLKFSKYGPGTPEDPWHSFSWVVHERKKHFHYNTQVVFFLTLLLRVYSSSIQKLTCDVTTD